jgi:hypothetical protein
MSASYAARLSRFSVKSGANLVFRTDFVGVDGSGVVGFSSTAVDAGVIACLLDLKEPGKARSRIGFARRPVLGGSTSGGLP